MKGVWGVMVMRMEEVGREGERWEGGEGRGLVSKVQEKWKVNFSCPSSLILVSSWFLD